jgi:glycosyltransferase involved in cell wall biosynthesis
MAYLRAPWDIDRRVAFCSADLLLPNSHGEAVAIRRELHVRTPMRVVPNGADPTLFSLPMEPVARDRVVYVGRLDPHKNQLGLIEALRGTGLPLLLVGATHPDHRQYADRCYAAARGYAVEFRSHVPHEQLASIYHSARVHAIPSFFETTGLASLEAALCGAAIVTTREGWAREYFGESAIYCRPESAESIRRAVDRAWRGGSDRALPGRIRQHFTWEQAAAETIRAYDALLSRRSMNGSEG